MKQPLRRIRQSGFTLIELMISMVIGLLILLALITLLVNVSRNNGEMGKTNRIIENGRFALQLLQADISHAGYWGGYVPQFDDLSLGVAAVPNDVPTAVPDPCLAYAPWNSAHISNLIGIAVQSYEIPAIVPSPTLSVCANRVTNPKASTDVLIVRHLERTANCDPAVTGCPLPTEGELYFQVALCGDTAPVPAYALGTYAAASFATDFPGKKRSSNCATAASAELRRFVSSLYYIRNFSVTAGDGIPTLMRSQFGPKTISGVTVLEHQAAEALIEGIEGFRVEFGIDNISDAGTNTISGTDSAGTTDPANLHSAAIKWADTTLPNTSPTNRGDGSPDGAYVRCTTAVPCTPAQLMNAVAVKLYVLVRSDELTPGYSDAKTYHLGSTTLGPFNDGFKRHLFTQTIRLVNVSTRRETP